MPLKLAPEPKYKKLYSQSKIEIAELKKQVEALTDKVYTLSDMVLSGKVGEIVLEDGLNSVTVPKQVAEWMVEYSLPWQVFKCDAHGLWVDELDSSFPYYMEQSTCFKCRK